MDVNGDVNSGSNPKELILIVDDEENQRLLLGEQLRLEGYRTAEAADGEEALVRVGEVLPDLVLLDIRMPRRNGFEVCRILKEEEATREIPVILVTGIREQEEIVRGFDAGADDYVIKPIYPAELLARVRSLLRNRQLHEQLKQELRRRESAVHELRTPLAVLKGYLRLLREGSLSKARRKMLEESMETLDRLTSLVIALSKRAGSWNKGIEVNARPGDLLACLRSALRHMDHMAARKGLKLKRALPASLPAVPFDRDRIIQVMINLVDNAIKFTDAGWIRVQASDQGDRVLVAVEDTGKGMEEKEIEVIFGEFVRARTDQEGCGLGLHISRQIIEAHGGEIRVQSTPDRGSRFTFSLPV